MTGANQSPKKELCVFWQPNINERRSHSVESMKSKIAQQIIVSEQGGFNKDKNILDAFILYSANKLGLGQAACIQCDKQKARGDALKKKASKWKLVTWCAKIQNHFKDTPKRKTKLLLFHELKDTEQRRRLSAA